jgi:nucleotide-binding universal stress UspA family protein
VHVLIATDGSQQSLEAAAYLKSFADPTAITSIAVLAVVSPLAAVPFANEAESGGDSPEDISFRRSAERATAQMADGLRGWAREVTTHVYGGSPSSEIVKAAREMGSGLIVIASSSSRTEAVLMGSVAHRVMSHAPCPVLVVRPEDKGRRSRRA